MELKFTDVGYRINSRLKELGLRQLDICQETGLSTTALSQYCTGKRIPDTASLYKLAVILQVSMEWILTGENATTEDSNSPHATLESIKLEQSLTCDGSPLDDGEADLIAMYRLLPDYVQEDIFDLIYMQYKKHIEKKRVSIYSTYTKGKSGSGMDDDAHGGTA